MATKKDTTKDTTKDTARSSSRTKNKAQKAPEEGNEADTSLVGTTDSPVPKSKSKGKQNEGSAQSGQPTLDKHLKPNTSGDTSDSEFLRNLQEKLNNLASQEYIEQKFKQMLTEDLLTKKLNELQKVIKEEVKKDIGLVNEQIQVITKRMTKMENVTECLRNQVSDLEIKTEQLEANNKRLTKENKVLEEKLSEREVKIRSLDDRNNDLEQYTRRNSIRIYGVVDSVTETENETCTKVLNLFNDKLRKKLVYTDIDAVHRLGKFRNDGNRPIIVKFVQRLTKMSIVKARRALKGSGQVIREDLTRNNAKLLQDVSSHDKVESAWSDEGRIIALLKNGRKLSVRHLRDLDTVSITPLTGSAATPASADTHF